jgi:hypothetical protein
MVPDLHAGEAGFELLRLAIPHARDNFIALARKNLQIALTAGVLLTSLPDSCGGALSCTFARTEGAALH